MKKLLSLLLVLTMLFGCVAMLGSCGSDTESKDTTDAQNTTATGDDTTAAVITDTSDSDYVKSKGKLVVGITDFAPMDYQDENGNWIGFDADVAKLFAAKLGLEVEFVEIVWDNKVMDLNSKTIDCVWNGMTLNDEVLAAMECSNAYCNNQQVVVVAADVADKYQSVEACKSLNFAVEAGSAGKAQAEANGFAFTEVENQAAALLEVASGTADAAIIDSLMARAMVGEGTGYASLTYTVGLNDEMYGVGFRKGSDLAQKLNDFFKENFEEIKTIADTYKTGASLIAQ